MSRPELKDLLLAATQSRAYDFAERAALWEERVLMHVADVNTVVKTRADAEPLNMPPVARLQPGKPAIDAPAAGTTGDLGFASAREISARIRSRDLSPVDVAEAVLKRVEQTRSNNMFITHRPEAVRAQARQLQERQAKGGTLGALAGVPLGVKDLMQVKGYPFTGGTRALPGGEAQARRCERRAPAPRRCAAGGHLESARTGLRGHQRQCALRPCRQSGGARGACPVAVAVVQAQRWPPAWRR